jgi:hypothetical protein
MITNNFKLPCGTILGHHMAQSKHFNWMVEKKKYLFGKYFEKLQMMPRVTFLSYHMSHS